jgi:predicted DNA-binding WGR domain protein
MRQVEMFPEDIRIERVDPNANMYRFYRLRLMPDLFGGVSLLREWGRIGTQGRHRIELFADAGQAADTMLAVYRSKQKRGYQLAA